MSNTDIGFNIDFYTLCYVKTIQLNCVSYMYISVTGKHYNIYFIVCFNGYQISRGDFGFFFSHVHKIKSVVSLYSYYTYFLSAFDCSQR